MSDLISRQDALDAFNHNLTVTGRENANEVRSYIKETMDKIKALPSEQQVTGKLNNRDGSLLTGDSEACKEQKSKLDLISRQDAVSIFMQRAKELAGFKGDIGGACEGAAKLIKSLPSADAVQIPIKLEKRYPQSRDEDITDAFMRGYLAGRSSADRPTEWIPVSEKLPKKGQKIIFTEHDHYAKQRGDGFPEEIIGVGTYFSYEEWNYSLTEHMAKKAGKEGFGKDHVIVHGRRYNVEESEITAWMPMPEPYREDGEEYDGRRY